MIKFNVNNETSKLAVLVLRISNNFGGIPNLEDCFFQTIGSEKDIMYKEGFKNQNDVDFLIHLLEKKILYSLQKRRCVI